MKKVLIIIGLLFTTSVSAWYGLGWGYNPYWGGGGIYAYPYMPYIPVPPTPSPIVVIQQPPTNVYIETYPYPQQQRPEIIYRDRIKYKYCDPECMRKYYSK